jgi:hypothetical protein
MREIPPSSSDIGRPSPSIDEKIDRYLDRVGETAAILKLRCEVMMTALKLVAVSDTLGEAKAVARDALDLMSRAANHETTELFGGVSDDGTGK